jgi:hypothetical protein
VEELTLSILTRDQLLGAKDCEPMAFESKIWGGTIMYRRAKVKEKKAARARATFPTGKGGAMEIDHELVDCALMCQCVIDPPMNAADFENLQEKCAVEVSRLAGLIVGTIDPQ